jgi:heme exporter protein B
LSGYAGRAWAVLWKDLLVERRAKESANALLFFTVTLLFLFQFALGTDRERLAAVLPGLLWLAVVLSGLLGLGRLFVAERENDCWEALRLVPGDKSAIFVGKLAANLVLLALLEVVLVVLVGLFYGISLGPVLPALAVVMALGTVGLAAIGTLFGALTAPLRAREVLFPLLLLPAQVPVLLGAVSATGTALAGRPLAEAQPWLGLLAAADCVYLVLGVLTFEFVLES